MIIGLSLIVAQLVRYFKKFAYQCFRCGHIFKKSLSKQLLAPWLWDLRIHKHKHYESLKKERGASYYYLFFRIWKCPKCQEETVTRALVEK